jgi:hypothetical protein
VFLDIPVIIKDQAIKYMRHHLWRKKNNDVQARGSALVAWDKICKRKYQGELSVLNLEVQKQSSFVETHT